MRCIDTLKSTFEVWGCKRPARRRHQRRNGRAQDGLVPCGVHRPPPARVRAAHPRTLGRRTPAWPRPGQQVRADGTVSGGSAMPKRFADSFDPKEYLLYFLEADGRVRRTEKQFFITERRAVEYISRLDYEHVVELWAGNQLVMRRDRKLN